MGRKYATDVRILTNRHVLIVVVVGNSCSMCWLVGPHILKHQKGLAKECESDDCPVTSMIYDEDRCLSCYEKVLLAKTLAVTFGKSMRRGQWKNVVIRFVRPCKLK